MDSKVIVSIIVPELDQVFDVYLPVNKKIGSIVNLLNQAINEITNNIYPRSDQNILYNVNTNKIYDYDLLVQNTDIRNGTHLVLFSK